MKHFNPEKRDFKGRSYKKRGQRIAVLKEKEVDRHEEVSTVQEEGCRPPEQKILPTEV